MFTSRKIRRKFWLLLPLALLLLAAALWLWHPWQRPIVIRESVNPRDGAAMVWIPDGAFRMGSDNREEIRDAIRRRDWTTFRDAVMDRLPGTTTSDEQPVHTVDLDGYWIYKYEVTVTQYRAFCLATNHAMPAEPAWGWRDDNPIVNVTWHDAAAYAAWAGSSLPTEAQWEKAARGVDGRAYPWGNVWDEAKCWHSSESPSPVGSYPAGASPYGAQDMAGNVREWCADWYDAEYYEHAPRRNPTGPTTGRARVLRGGSWDFSGGGYTRGADRGAYHPYIWYDGNGFRCVSLSPGL